MKILAAGLSTISICGSGAGVGVLFAGFLDAFSRNPLLEQKLFSYVLLGFALTESVALFGLMITFNFMFTA